jgi:circadian clock protein KaiC
VTAIITGERGTETLTREGLEEYVSDCVVVLDHRVTGESSTRRLRVVKYRGSVHGTNEYPFLIDETGFSVLPVTSLGLSHKVSSERISSGVPQLDEMMGSKGYYRGTSVLVSGTAGTGKSSLAAHFADSTCRNGQKVLYFAFEESPAQMARNMKSIGIDLQQWVKKGLLKLFAERPLHGIEMHLTWMIKNIKSFKPDVVIIDPLNSFVSGENILETKSMAIRLIDFLKVHEITGFFTSLTYGGSALEQTNVLISSLIDTWLFLRDIEMDGERNRGLYILKSRGMSHSNQIREFLLTDKGIELREVSLGANGVLTGTARLVQEAKDREEKLLYEQELERRKFDLDRKKRIMEAQIEVLRAEFESEKAEVLKIRDLKLAIEKSRAEERKAFATSRKSTTK